MDRSLDIKHFFHLYYRAGFGVSYKTAFYASHKDITVSINELFKDSESFTDLEVAMDGLPDKKEIRQMKNLSAEEKKQLSDMLAKTDIDKIEANMNEAIERLNKIGNVANSI